MIEKGKISAEQFMLSITCFLVGSGLLSSIVMVFTKQDSWLTVLIGLAASLLIVLIYVFLLKEFPGKNLIEINDAVFGSILGMIVSLLHIFFFLSLISLNIRDVGIFMTGFALTQTPMSAIIFMFLFVLAWAVRCGVETITRYSFISLVAVIVVTLFNVALLITEMDINNFLPMFTLPLKNYIISSYITAAIPFCEIIAFMMIAPSVRETAKIKRSYLLGLAMGAAYMEMIVTRNISVLGPLQSVLTQPIYASVRLINLAEIFTRMEILYAFFIILFQYFKISILYYATVLAIAQLLKLKSYRSIAIPVGIIASIFALNLFASEMEHVYWNEHAAASYSSIFVIILPVLAALIAVLKRGKQPADAAAAGKGTN